jgi:hypothetical protein
MLPAGLDISGSCSFSGWSTTMDWICLCRPIYGFFNICSWRASTMMQTAGPPHGTYTTCRSSTRGPAVRPICTHLACSSWDQGGSIFDQNRISPNPSTISTNTEWIGPCIVADALCNISATTIPTPTRPLNPFNYLRKWLGLTANPQTICSLRLRCTTCKGSFLYVPYTAFSKLT